MLADQCSAAEIAFHFDEPEEPVVVPGEKAKLRQAFLNLLSNAVKFTDTGGAVTVRLKRDAAATIVEIADTGIGMSPEGIDVALTPFGQVDNRLERKYEGTGLGLPLAKSLIELHGGNLSIESAPEKGTLVRIYLPDEQSGEATRPLAIAL
jgi:signal transduction histidine kinase